MVQTTQYPPFIKFAVPSASSGTGDNNSKKKQPKLSAGNNKKKTEDCVFYKIPIADVLEMRPSSHDDVVDVVAENMVMVPSLDKLHEHVSLILDSVGLAVVVAPADHAPPAVGHYSYQDSEGDWVLLGSSKALAVALEDCCLERSLKINILSQTKPKEAGSTRSNMKPELSSSGLLMQDERIQLLEQEAAELRQVLEHKEEEVAALQQSLAHNQASICDREREIDVLQQTLSHKEATISAHDATIQSLQETVSHREQGDTTISELEDRLQERNDDMAAQTAAIEKLTATVGLLRENLQNVEETAKEREDMLLDKQKEDAFKQKNLEMDLSDKEHELDTLKVAMKECVAEHDQAASDFQRELAHKHELIDAQREALQKLQEDVGTKDGELVELEKVAAASQAKAEQAQEVLQQQAKEVDFLTAANRSLEDKSDRLKMQLVELQTQTDELLESKDAAIEELDVCHKQLKAELDQLTADTQNEMNCMKQQVESLKMCIQGLEEDKERLQTESERAAAEVKAQLVLQQCTHQEEMDTLQTLVKELETEKASLQRDMQKGHETKEQARVEKEQVFLSLNATMETLKQQIVEQHSTIETLAENNAKLEKAAADTATTSSHDKEHLEAELATLKASLKALQEERDGIATDMDRERTLIRPCVHSLLVALLKVDTLPLAHKKLCKDLRKLLKRWP